MKKYILSLLLAVSCVAAADAQFYAVADYSLSNVAVPVVPAKLDFAGEAVPLGNYDTHESMMREMAVTSYMHSRTLITLLSTKRYFAIIEPILKKNGIPADFKYLCMAESGLNPDVVSSAKAAGLWQLMPAVGLENGMVVGGDVDERYNIEKATEAACRHLRDSYERFGSWTLAAAAYNLGNAGLDRRLTEQGVDNYYDVYLPAETLRYMFRVLSFKVITENPAAYGFAIRPDEYLRPQTDYCTVTVNDSPIEWSKFAREHGTTYKMLRELNHWIRSYRYDNRERRTFAVKIPNKEFRNR